MQSAHDEDSMGTQFSDSASSISLEMSCDEAGERELVTVASSSKPQPSKTKAQNAPPSTSERKRKNAAVLSECDDDAFFDKMTQAINQLSGSKRNVGFATVIGQQTLHLMEKLEEEDPTLFNELATKVSNLNHEYMASYFQRKTSASVLIIEGTELQVETNEID